MDTFPILIGVQINDGFSGIFIGVDPVFENDGISRFDLVGYVLDRFSSAIFSGGVNEKSLCLGRRGNT
jgi:hypothetical protein